MNSARPILLCLHGWGGTKESFTELREALRNDSIEILAPDLPGFGSEREPDRPWSTDDYAEWVEQWINGKLGGAPLWILGHSHGGRIALKMVKRGNVKIDRLFLCAAAGIRHPRHFKRIVGLTLAKTGKFFLSIPLLNRLEPIGKKFLYRLVRVHDYEQASPLMRQTLIEVSREDLRPILSAINVPTDIFWGEDDRMTPVSDGKLMNEKIRGSSLLIFPNTRHRVHRDRAPEIVEVIRGRMAGS